MNNKPNVFYNKGMEQVEPNEDVILARIRTLLALERNYLAEERTALAELRTGLALALIGPPASGVVTYMSPTVPIEATVLFISFLAIIIVAGIWMSIRSRSALKTIREKKRIVKEREAMTIRSSKAVYELFGDFIDAEEK